MSFLLGIMACISVISIVYCVFKENKQNKILGILAKYNLPIFVMHTIFVAGFRSVLIKIGVTNMTLHILIGVTVSFVGPIIMAWIMEKTRFLNFFLYPSRCISIPKS